MEELTANEKRIAHVSVSVHGIKEMTDNWKWSNRPVNWRHVRCGIFTSFTV